MHRHWKPLCLCSLSGYGPGVNVKTYITPPRPFNTLVSHVNAVRTLTHLPHVCFICVCTTAVLLHVTGLYRVFLWFFKNWGTPSELFLARHLISQAVCIVTWPIFVWLSMCIICYRRLLVGVFKLSVTKYMTTMTKQTCEVGKTLILFDLRVLKVEADLWKISKF